MQAEARATVGPAPVPSGVALRFHMVIPATPLAVRQTVQDAATHVRRARGSPDLAAIVELILAEAMNNIVEHAHAGRSGGVIELVLQLDGGLVRCVLRDDGTAMPGECLPAIVMPDPATGRDALAEGGFGWPMIGALCRDMRYTRASGWNETELTLATRPGPAAPSPALA